MPQAPASNRPGRTCPNCHAFVPLDNPRCAACRLEVKQMDAFAAAKKAAQAKGIRGVSTGPRELPFYLQPGNIAKVVFVLAIVGVVAYFLRPKPPRYLQFPATATAAVKTLLADVSTGDDKGFDQAYGLIADSARDPKANDQRGDYLQMFDVMNNYLAGEFGGDWATQAQYAPDAADANTIVVKVGVETLHFHTAQQTPADKKAQQGEHYAITGMDEFDPQDAADFRQMEGIKGFLRAEAGNAAVNNLTAVLGALGNDSHKPFMVRKIGLLAVFRNPHTVVARTVLKAYPQQLRNDPVIRNRLTMMTTDGRYDPQVQSTAQEVLEDKVPEEELIGTGTGQ